MDAGKRFQYNRTYSIIQDMPLLIVISGPSAGVGKGTIIKELLKRDPNLYLSKSVTTRPKRDYETEGVEYYFRSEEEFEGMLQKDEFLEWV